MDEIGVIILAAGSSSRLGHSKQLLPYDGETLLRKSVKDALLVSKYVTTVLGAEFDLHKKEIRDLETSVVFNLDWRKGMGSSLKCGLNHLHKSHTTLDGVIVMVCDQPFLNVKHLNKLKDAFSKGHEIVASSYNNTMGVPVLVARQHFKELLKIPDDNGAKAMINQYDPFLVEFPKGATDIDTIRDWQTFNSK